MPAEGGRPGAAGAPKAEIAAMAAEALPLLRAPFDGLRLPDGRRVVAVMSTRAGGVSAAPFDSLNLRPPALGGTEVDVAEAVAENQRRFAQALGATPRWLRQVHGQAVQRWTGAAQAGSAPVPELPTADACTSTATGVVCAVQVADCLPVLLLADGGRGIGAAHAGWRGLAGGVLEATVAALCADSGCAPAQLQAWLGACIGPEAFEVGPEVLQAFGVEPAAAGRGAGAMQDAGAARGAAACFVARPRADGSPRWLADLPGLARRRLQALGLQRISSAGACTVQGRSRFFSYRRDGRTGRQAAAIVLLPG